MLTERPLDFLKDSETLKNLCCKNPTKSFQCFKQSSEGLPRDIIFHEALKY